MRGAQIPLGRESKSEGVRVRGCVKLVSGLGRLGGSNLLFATLTLTQ
jgi:hypothetical protein